VPPAPTGVHSRGHPAEAGGQFTACGTASENGEISASKLSPFWSTMR
jgi:hypothetical protein